MVKHLFMQEQDVLGERVTTPFAAAIGTHRDKLSSLALPYYLFSPTDRLSSAHITLTKGIFVGLEVDAPERLAARFDEVTERIGETVPQSGAAQGTVEVGKAVAAASRR